MNFNHAFDTIIMVNIMKDKNGFTLIELLGVIVILAIIMTIAIPSATGISNKIKENMYCEKIDFIEEAAKTYGSDIIDSLTSTGIDITVKQLVEKGYLKKDQDSDPLIVDPRDQTSNELYNMSLKIILKYNRPYVEFNTTVKNTCDK